jgi:hypothetical protein
VVRANIDCFSVVRDIYLLVVRHGSARIFNGDFYGIVRNDSIVLYLGLLTDLHRQLVGTIVLAYS